MQLLGARLDHLLWEVPTKHCHAWCARATPKRLVLRHKAHQRPGKCTACRPMPARPAHARTAAREILLNNRPNRKVFTVVWLNSGRAMSSETSSCTSSRTIPTSRGQRSLKVTVWPKRPVGRVLSTSLGVRRLHPSGRHHLVGEGCVQRPCLLPGELRHQRGNSHVRLRQLHWRRQLHVPAMPRSRLLQLVAQHRPHRVGTPATGIHNRLHTTASQRHRNRGSLATVKRRWLPPDLQRRRRLDTPATATRSR